MNYMARWVREGGAASRDPKEAERMLAEIQRERPVKVEPVRTAFDSVFPGMPPAIKLTA